MKHLVLLLAGGLLLTAGARAQDAQPGTRDSLPLSGPPQPNVLDARDLLADLLGRPRPRLDSTRARFSLVPGVGFSEQTGISGSLTGIYAFRSHAAGVEEKLSSIVGGVTLAAKGQLVVPINAVVFTRHNNWSILADWRYMRYPSYTWGLGPETKEAARYTLDFNYLKLHQALLRRLSGHLYAGLGYHYDRIWNIRELDVPAGTVLTDYQRYGLRNTNVASGPAARVVYDSRYNPINPARGWYASATFRVNTTGLGSDSNWQALLAEVRHYIPLGRGGRNVLALWSYNWLTIGDGRPPYLLLPSTGWDDFYNTGRGYVQGRYRGRNLMYLEAEYRMSLTRNGLLGAVIFANAQTFPEKPFGTLGHVVPGAGVGLRIKLDKYSATNIALDLGFAPGGTALLALNIGEVF